MRLTQQALTRCQSDLGHRSRLTPDQAIEAIKALGPHIDLSPPDPKADELAARVGADAIGEPLTALQAFEIVAQFPFLQPLIRSQVVAAVEPIEPASLPMEGHTAASLLQLLKGHERATLILASDGEGNSHAQLCSIEKAETHNGTILVTLYPDHYNPISEKSHTVLDLMVYLRGIEPEARIEISSDGEGNYITPALRVEYNKKANTLTIYP